MGFDSSEVHRCRSEEPSGTVGSQRKVSASGVNHLDSSRWGVDAVNGVLVRGRIPELVQIGSSLRSRIGIAGLSCIRGHQKTQGRLGNGSHVSGQTHPGTVVGS